LRFDGAGVSAAVGGCWPATNIGRVLGLIEKASNRRTNLKMLTRA
jgi:hypothetical protein